MDELIAVALPSDGALARALVIRTAALARTMGARWAAFFIRASGRFRFVRPREESLSMVQVLSLAAHLGGTPICCDSEDVPFALLTLAEREGVVLLILGASHRSPLLQRLFPGTTQRVLRADRNFDVVIAGKGLIP